MNFDTIISIVQLLLGVSLFISGATVFYSMPALGGFILGGLVGMETAGLVLAGSPLQPVAPLVGFVVAGIVGALIAIPLSIVLVLLAGSALGAVVGTFISYIVAQQGITQNAIHGIMAPQNFSPAQSIIVMISVLIFAGLTIRYDEFMLVLSTSFLGSYVAVVAASNLAGDTFIILRNPIFMAFLWLGLGLLGTIYQNYSVDQ